MKVQKIAVTTAVCTALMGSQTGFAEEQALPAEGMDFAFDYAKVSSAQMAELSATEMGETKGAGSCQAMQAQGFMIGCFSFEDIINGGDWSDYF